KILSAVTLGSITSRWQQWQRDHCDVFARALGLLELPERIGVVVAQSEQNAGWRYLGQHLRFVDPGLGFRRIISTIDRGPVQQSGRERHQHRHHVEWWNEETR